MRACVRASVLVLFLFCCLPGIRLAQAQASSAAASPAHPSTGRDPESSTSMMIPGPLHSFLRMAAISQKALPEEVLPLLSRNAVIQGYAWQGRSGRPTEYLILLRRYVDQ